MSSLKDLPPQIQVLRTFKIVSAVHDWVYYQTASRFTGGENFPLKASDRLKIIRELTASGYLEKKQITGHKIRRALAQQSGVCYRITNKGRALLAEFGI